MSEEQKPEAIPMLVSSDLAGKIEFIKPGEIIELRGKTAVNWQPPPESERPDGYRCLVTVDLEWHKGYGWGRVADRRMFMLTDDAPDLHGFMPAPPST